LFELDRPVTLDPKDDDSSNKSTDMALRAYDLGPNAC